MTVNRSLLERCVPYDGKKHQWPQILSIIIVFVGAITCGAHFSWMSPSVPILTSNSSHVNIITLEEASYFAIIAPIAGAITSPIIAILMDIVGRKKCVAFIVVPQFMAWIMIAFAQNLYVFYAATFLAGAAHAFFFTAVPTYVGEIALPSVRGSWGNLVAIGIYFGQFIVNAVGAYCDIPTTALIFGCFPVLHFLLLLQLPESPYFLLMKDRKDEARESLKKLRWMENVEDELMTLSKDVQRQVSESGTIKDMFTVPTNRKALLISIAIRASQQFSGLPAFNIYTQYMFNESGGNLSASTSAIIFSAMMFIFAGGFGFIVDRFGRKPLMTFSSFGCAVVLAIEATYFYVSQKTNIDVSEFSWLPLTGMVTYIVVCSAGLAIIPTLMLGELFSASVKGKALCLLNITFAFFVLSVPKLFQLLTSNFGMFVPFYFFSGCCVLSAIFSYYCVPETKGKTLEQIQQELKGSSYEKDTECTAR